MLRIVILFMKNSEIRRFLIRLVIVAKGRLMGLLEVQGGKRSSVNFLKGEIIFK